MNIIYSETALRDLEEIYVYQSVNWPGARRKFEERIRAAHLQIAAFPNAAPEVSTRPNVRVTGLLPFPYRLFYRIDANGIAVLHVRHVARKPFEI